MEDRENLIEVDSVKRKLAMQGSIPRTAARPVGSQNVRDTRIDFWRGVCITGMVVWHLLTDASFPRWFSFGIIQGFNFVAEGFVFLAGMAAGIVHLRGTDNTIGTGRFLRRAGAMLLVNYSLTLVLVGVFAASAPVNPQIDGLSGRAVWRLLTLQHQPYLGDVLSIFVFLFAATPLVLLARRCFGDGLVFGGSLGLFILGNAIYEVFPNDLARSLDLNANGAFDFNTWQFLFVSGLLCSQRREALYQLARDHFWRLFPVFTVGFAATAAYRLATANQSFLSAPIPSFMLDSRHPLTIPRIAYVGTQAILIAMVTVAAWSRAEHCSVVRVICLLGRRSLPVFVCSVLLDYALKDTIRKCGLAFPWNLSTLALELMVLCLVAWSSDARNRYVSRTACSG